MKQHSIHLTLLAVFCLVIFNNLDGKREAVKENVANQGTSILFSAILKNTGDPSFIEQRMSLAGGEHGVGGLNADIMNGAILTSQSPNDPAEDLVLMPTVGSNALVPLEVLNQEIIAGPIEEERKETVKHTVSPGESIGLIAEKYSVSVTTILTANKLSAQDYIKPGDILLIPPVSGVLYTVKSGDTLGEIASTYKGEVAKILDYNNLANENSIRIGETLMIPGGKIPAPSPSSSQAYQSNESSNHPIYSPEAQKPSSGSWIWPTASHRVNQYYSYSHSGVDLDGNIGNNIYASHSGTIIFAGWRSGYGNCIIISHPGGEQTLYGHLSGYKRKSGSVGSGEAIGYIGSTGWSTGPHLHFEIRTDRGRINPLNWIK